MTKKTILLILDGWGIPENENTSAIYHAKTPFIDSLYKNYPNATLLTHGMNVGLPDGQMGNSEVGHMNIGAGRIVYQDLVKINLAIKNNTLKDEQVLNNAFNYAKTNNKNVHFLGLVSDGGVHSHIKHLKGLIAAADEFGLKHTYIHAFTDGRDVDPKSGIHHLTDLQETLKNSNAKLASVVGRYYAMDRDKRWERVAKAYNLLVKGEGIATENINESIQESYANNITDEFINPHVITENGQPITTIKNGDVVIFFNFRTDRGRQLTTVLTQEDFPEFGMQKLKLHFTTMTNYNESFKNVNVIFDKENIEDTLGEVLSKNGKTQIRIAETEKYPHVTFFFNGGHEQPFENEKRILCPSPTVATYDMQPEMSSHDITKAIIPEIEKQDTDFICLNFANPDMVGHTGSMEAAVKSCEATDVCAKQVIEAALKNNYTTIVIADHGNCEKMFNDDGSPNTAHTTNPVPIIIVDKDIKTVKHGVLGNVAPTILKLLGVKQPESMTQKPLI
jgi:2,3-bisphosphoglycerate-independent phosphoglycerate mutase